MNASSRKIDVSRLGFGRFPSPLRLTRNHGQGIGRFVDDSVVVRDTVEYDAANPPSDEMLWERAGPREHLFFDPANVRAAIVTCGGLCPGLNNVIRSLFLELHFNYGVTEILGLREGYRGLNPVGARPPIRLTTDLVSYIHNLGGTILASSRGSQDIGTMVDYLRSLNVNVLFTIGGDGTQRGAHGIAAEALRRGIPLSVIGIPKTIDADIQYCDTTFGFSTAVERAREAVYSAHVEAKGTPCGVGLVKLMGRDAGFIACGATVVSQDINFTLIPEVQFDLHGECGLLSALERRLDHREHAVIVVAEGAGQHLFTEHEERDASGNKRYHDIGLHLKHEILKHFRQRGREVEVKYIDPSYTIRSVRANCEDSLLCDRLARNAVHAAMSGKTDVMIGLRNGTFVHVPIAMATGKKRVVNPEGDLWNAVLGATGQPAHMYNRELVSEIIQPTAAVA